MEIDKFWTRGNLKERITNALNEAGLNKDDLKIEDLHPIDQYHARGILATKELAEKVNVKENQTIIDVGCGLAGPARYFANKFKCNVFGIDITPAFIEVGIDFNKKTKMDDKVSLEVSDGHTLPFDNNKFDGAISQHVTTNINNRERFFSEIYRVLKPTGSCWVNIGDTYNNKKLLQVPSRFEIAMGNSSASCPVCDERVVL